MREHIGPDKRRFSPWMVLAGMLAVLLCATALLHSVAHPAGATVMLDPVTAA